MMQRDWPTDLYPVSHFRLWVISYRDMAKISRDKDTCGAIITQTTVIKVKLTWKQHAQTVVALFLF